MLSNSAAIRESSSSSAEWEKFSFSEADERESPPAYPGSTFVMLSEKPPLNMRTPRCWIVGRNSNLYGSFRFLLIVLASIFASFVESVRPARRSRIVRDSRSSIVAKFVLSARSPGRIFMFAPSASRGPRWISVGL